MRIFLTVILSIFIFCTQPLWAACTKSDTTAGCDAGKYCDTSNESNHICADCPNKFYCPGGTTEASAVKKSCDSKYDGSESPRTKQEHCYKNCQTLNESTTPQFENGTWVPATSKINYPSTECSYPESNITCTNASIKCTGFHVENKKCIANVQNCTGTKPSYSYNGRKIYDPATSSYSECYITECPDDRHKENTGTICSITYAQECATNSGNCNSKLGNCSGGTIKGQYTWESSYNYDACSCEKELTVTSEGTYINSCKLTNNQTGNDSSWGNCSYKEIISCDVGMCQSNPASIKCSPAPKGYYSVADNITCDKCPEGATTAGQNASAKTECYISSVTKFIDKKNNEFNLPIGTINYTEP